MAADGSSPVRRRAAGWSEEGPGAAAAPPCLSGSARAGLAGLCAAADAPPRGDPSTSARAGRAGRAGLTGRLVAVVAVAVLPGGSHSGSLARRP